MKRQYFDLFKGHKKNIIITDKNKKKATFKSEHVIFINKEKKQQKFKKVIDFPSSRRLILKKRLSTKKNTFPFIKMTLWGMVLFLVLIFSNGFSIGFQTKEKIEQNSFLAIEFLMTGIKSLKEEKWEKAIKNFTKAEKTFQETRNFLKPFRQENSTFFTFHSDVKTSDNFLQFGYFFSCALKNSLKIFQKINAVFKEMSIDKNYLKLTQEVEQDFLHVFQDLISSKYFLEEIKKSFYARKFKNELEKAEKILINVFNLSVKIKNSFKTLKKILGQDHPHTILFLLQNSDEIRASGGFIGSLLFITFNDGIITQNEFKDVFEFDSHFKKGSIDQPEPFSKLAPDWGLRDANYFPNFSQSAKVIQWFLEHEKGNSVDSIIALNDNFTEKFLKIMGEISLPQVNEKVNANNFSQIMSFFVEAKIFGKNTPKKILQDFLPIFLNNFKKLSLKQISTVLKEIILEKHLMAFSFQKEVQNFFSFWNLEGNFKRQKKESFLSVIQTSISGNKSDAFMQEKISHKSFINLSGDVFSEVKISRQHDFDALDEENFEKLWHKFGHKSLLPKEKLKNILGQGTNKVYTRIFAPKGSKIFSLKGLKKQKVKTYLKDDFTVFAFYFPTVLKAEKKTVELTWTENLKLDFSSAFNFCWQKQAGVWSNYFHKYLELESGLKVINKNINLPFYKKTKTDQCFSIFISKESLVF